MESIDSLEPIKLTNHIYVNYNLLKDINNIIEKYKENKFIEENKEYILSNNKFSSFNSFITFRDNGYIIKFVEKYKKECAYLIKINNNLYMSIVDPEYDEDVSFKYMIFKMDHKAKRKYKEYYIRYLNMYNKEEVANFFKNSTLLEEYNVI